MGFTVYKPLEKNQRYMFEDSSREWHWHMWYHDGCEGGKQREKDFAKVMKKEGCKVVWDEK